MKEIVIQPVSRIEGGAKVVIQLDDQGNVADTYYPTGEAVRFQNPSAVKDLPGLDNEAIDE